MPSIADDQTGFRFCCSCARACSGDLRLIGVLFGVVLPILLWCETAGAGDKPFDMSANWGATGLMEIPTARILPDGAMRLGYAKASPYEWSSFGFGVLPGLEFTGRYLDVTNISADLGPEFGSFKDKAFHIKYQLLPESKFCPAIALGGNDFQGTQLFESQYLVVSRQLYPLDLTLGVGRHRLKGPLSIGSEIGFWGGIEWAATERLHLMMEYNPIEYQKDRLPPRGVPEGSDWPFNIGLRYRTWFGFDFGLSYQRGDTLSAAVHLQFDLGRPILPPRPDPPVWGFAISSEETLKKGDRNARQLAETIAGAGFIEVHTRAQDCHLIAEFENAVYLSDAQAAGRVMRMMLPYADCDTDSAQGTYLTLVMKRNGLRILFVSVAAQDARQFFMGRMPLDHFKKRLVVISQFPQVAGTTITTAEEISNAASHQAARKKLSYGIDPVLESFFDQATAAYQSRLSLMPYATVDLWPGGKLHGSLDIPLYSDIGSTVEIISGAVRSDSWEYLGAQPTIHRLLLDQVIKVAPPTYLRLSSGYLERMYAGAGGELLTFIDGGQWAAGLEGDWVRKREPDTPWALTGQYHHTLLGNLYYRYLPLDITVKTQVGRFLAGDTGLRFEFRRRFDTGAEVGFWYSLTDTDHLTGFNRGYNDKGISLTIPFATFTDQPSRQLLRYRISPWTRDVGSTIRHWQEIYDTAADLNPLYFRYHLDAFDQ